MPSAAAPPAPAAALDVFGDALASAERYASLLAGPGVDRGLLGPREVGRLWERHLLNCAVLGELIPRGSVVIDVGSGAGLPGIVLAIARPDLTLTLVEPLLRRATFLTECVPELELTNVEVLRARAEEVAGRRRTEVVTARAVAPLARLAEWTFPLLRPGGRLLAIKGERAEAELDEAEPTLRALGARSGEVLRVGHGKVDPPATVVRVTAGRTRHRETPNRGTRRGARVARRQGVRPGEHVGQAKWNRKR
jgi:16S rRNA (guanine527-N7)-methyltransferase